MKISDYVGVAAVGVDARLIAAAPELLAALKAVVDWQGIDHENDCPEDDTCTCTLVAQVNAAIAKAEGSA